MTEYVRYEFTAAEVAARPAKGHRYEYRHVECSTVLDDPRQGIASVYRNDTGELVRARLMNRDEMAEEANRD